MIKELPSEPLTLTTDTKYLPTYTNYKSNTNSVTKYTVLCRALIIGEAFTPKKKKNLDLRK